MKARKLPSGRWNARVMVAGKSMSFTADTKKEAERLAAIAQKSDVVDITLGEAIDRYISSKTAVLSASTIRGYRTIEKNYIDPKTSLLRLDKVTNEKLQRCVNECAKTHSPKTVCNLRGLLTSALSMFRPDFVPRITVPAKEKVRILVPTEHDLKIIMDAVKGTKDELPVLIAAFGSCRRSEICAILPDCVFDDHIEIKRSIVPDENDNWVMKERPKSWAGYRNVYLPSEIMQLVHEAAAKTEDGKPIVGMLPSTLSKRWTLLKKSLGLPPYHFHALRHYFATFSHQIGISDKQIQEAGGWGDISTLHKIYQHTMPEYRADANAKIQNYYDQLKKA